MRDELDLYIRARYPLLWVVTAEEQRALREIDELGKAQRKRVQLWSTTRGLVNAALPDREDTSKRDPLQLLKSILDDSEAGIWVLRDFHPFLKDAGVVRRLREIAFSQSDQKANKTVILLGPVLKLPPELEKEIAVVDFDLPTSEQLQRRLDDMTARLQEASRIEVRLDRRQRAQLVQACLGLTAVEADNALAKAVVQAEGVLDGRAIEAVTAEKKQIIRKSGLLEYYDNTELIDNVGGLDTLKSWLRKRVRAFTDEARVFGLPAPKGILLVGVQGCGKSLIARSVASMWRLPLLRLDAGRLFASLVGSSE
ncbi:MAG: AAA family ATPase, partial [Caldilineaceae bacterium]|nr:AAA family ATPase [Caldilineaceae bacterium]